MSEYAVVIPARYASERLPGKPLLQIAGLPMLQHVWNRAIASGATEVVIATDDDRIAVAAEKFGATACMTDAGHTSGTDRIAEVANLRGWPDEAVVVNLQGDEPLMPAELIRQCSRLLDDADVSIGTLASPLTTSAAYQDPNVVKVVLDAQSNALYFSRSAIPYSRGEDTHSLALKSALQHHGIYAYRCGDLRRLVATPPVALEQAERLEQLRAMVLGMTIRVAIPAVRPGPGVDTPGDLEEVARLLEEQG